MSQKPKKPRRIKPDRELRDIKRDFLKNGKVYVKTTGGAIDSLLYLREQIQQLHKDAELGPDEGNYQSAVELAHLMACNTRRDLPAQPPNGSPVTVSAALEHLDECLQLFYDRSDPGYWDWAYDHSKQTTIPFLEGRLHYAGLVGRDDGLTKHITARFCRSRRQARLYLDELDQELVPFHRHWAARHHWNMDYSHVANAASFVVSAVVGEEFSPPNGSFSYQRLRRHLDGLRHRLDKRRQSVPATSLSSNGLPLLSNGRLTVAHASEKYEVAKSTLHCWLNHQPSLDKQRDDATGATTLSEAALKKLLKAKGRPKPVD